MSDYYNTTGVPTPLSKGSSQSIRDQFALTDAGFNKVVPLGGNGDKAVFVNSAGSAQVAKTAAEARVLLGIDITVDTYQDLRDYIGSENAILVEGNAGTADGGGGFFLLVTGAAPGFYADNNYNIIVPTGGDGSEAWLCTAKPFISIANLKKFPLIAGVAVSTQGYTTAGDGGGAEYLIAANQAVDGFGDHLLANTNVALLQPVNGEINLRQYGAACDGIVDDTAELAAANTRLEGTPITLVIDGTPLISSTITILLRVKWRFTGAFGINGSGVTGFWSFIKKASTLNGPAIHITNAAKGVTLIGGGIEGVAGNGGDGLVIEGNSAVIRDFSVLAMGNDGIRIGNDEAGTNSNSFFLDNVYSAANGRDGFHIADNIAGGSSNSNAGSGNGLHATVNGRHGLYAQNVAANTFTNYHAETNTGWGLYLDTYSEQFTFVGGDVEGNVAGDIFVESARLLVTGAANNGSGLVRITVADTSQLATSDIVKIDDIVGTTEANGFSTITVINGTTFDLQGSTFANAYISGGLVNNFAGSHDLNITYGNVFTDTGFLTSDRTQKGNGKSATPVNAQGSWTPTLLGATTPGTPTYNTAFGQWQLVGDWCSCYFDVGITTTTGMVGIARIGGMPFPQANDKTIGTITSIGNVLFPVGTTASGLEAVTTGSTEMNFSFSGDSISVATINVTNLNTAGNTRIKGVITYKAIVSGS